MSDDSGEGHSVPSAVDQFGADPAALGEQVRAAWTANAAFWDEQMGEGNTFQRLLVGPSTERLLALRPGERVLDIACGNGVMARRLASLSAEVVACDLSAPLIERARARTQGTTAADHITYTVADASDEGQLLALGEDGSFDAAICNMAIMDMAQVAPMLRAVRRLLRPGGGRFVFSLLHPCFNSTGIRLVAEEEEDRDGQLTTTLGVLVKHYSQPHKAPGVAMAGQPEPHMYFHRPLALLFGACFAAGWVIDGLEEPHFSEPQETQRVLSWSRYTDMPPVLAVRLRPQS